MEEKNISDELKRKKKVFLLFMSIITACPCHAVKWKLTEHVCAAASLSEGSSQQMKESEEMRRDDHCEKK